MTDARAEAVADLADLILNVGRLVRARTPQGTEVIPLTETERHVMRLVDLHPGCTPSDIARWSRLQRTNVSTALRTLEDKGMVSRDSGGGRSVSVSPTRLAAENLQVLRAAWSRQLDDAVPGDDRAIRRTIDLLTRIEQALLRDPV